MVVKEGVLASFTLIPKTGPFLERMQSFCMSQGFPQIAYSFSGSIVTWY